MVRILTLVLTMAAALPAQEGKAVKEDERFARLKKLVGEWAGEDGKVAAKYALTAGGSALVETVFPGTSHEMLTVYRMDGKELVLTHFCVLQNQPSMKAAEKFDGKTLAFSCTGVGNAKSHDDMHMHSALFTFTDEDHLTTAWGSSEKGKDGEVHSFTLTRKK